MVEAAQSRHGNDDRVRSGLRLYWPPVWRVLFQGVVNAVVVVVVHVIADQPAEMLFVQGIDMVQDFAPNTPHPSFRDPVLPRRLDARPFWFQTSRLQKRNHVSIEFRIAVQDHVSVRGCLRKRFTQLLDDPLRSWVAGHVEV